MERMRRDACGGCERRDACASLWPQALGFLSSRDRPAAPRRGMRPAFSSENPILAFLGQVARSFEERAATHKPSFQAEVERRIEPLLALGPVRIAQVADELGCSRQTLYRKLRAEGVTFEKLLDRVRRRFALRLVREPGISVKEAAYRLGFSDPAAFSRAFKRWTGSSPRAMQSRRSRNQ